MNCDKCFCYVCDTVMRPLNPTDTFYPHFKVHTLRTIAPILTKEILRIVNKMDTNYLLAPLSQELVYSCILCIEAGFVKHDRTIKTKAEFSFKNPLTYTHLHLSNICTQLKMELGGIHACHSGEPEPIVTLPDSDDLYA